MPNQLEEQLRIIQQYRNIAKQLITKETNPDKRVKLAQKIAYYNRQEKEYTQKKIGEEIEEDE